MTADRGHLSPPDLSDAFAEALAHAGVAADPQDVDGHLALLRSVAQLEAHGRLLLRDTVRSARASGATWAAIGQTLDMSKQAAQKRFGAEADPATPLHPDERILGPVTAFDEMRELELAGRYGWHSVDFGPHHHRVVHSDTQWEHQRVTLMRSRTRASLREQGWQVIKSEFPYTYLKRDLGTPALVEPDPAPRTWGPATSSEPPG